MTTARKTALKNGTAIATSSILGNAHLIFQSIADGCLNLEGTIVSKLTDKTYDEVRQDRYIQTRKTQAEIISLFTSFKEQMHKEHSDTMDAVTNLGEQ